MATGIALSGGGFRASAFHLGVLARLNDDDLLGAIDYISTVSGGTLVTGLIYAANDYTWPSKEAFEERVVHHVYQTLTTKNLQQGLIWDTILRPFHIFMSRAGRVSKMVREDWGIDKNFSELPSEPRWMINATCFETGRNWRFETNSNKGKPRMGGVHFGYEFTPEIPLSDAMAASAGFPVAIGPLSLATAERNWEDYPEGSTFETIKIEPPFEKVHLWDGGVYDNLGLEKLDQLELERLFVSNASGKFKSAQKYKVGVGGLMRLISITKYQIEALRGRDVVRRYIANDIKGNYFDTGNLCKDVLESALRVPGLEVNYTEAEIPTLCRDFLPAEDSERAATISTEIEISAADFQLLFHHGYEVADFTLFAYGRGEHELLTYDLDKWSRVFV